MNSEFTDRINEKCSKASDAIKWVEKHRQDELKRRIVLQSDEDYLLYSIANSLLVLVELTIRKMEERQ